MRNWISGIPIATLLGAAVFVGVSTQANAVAPSDVKIVKIGYNANGADTLVNRNREYIDIYNGGTTPVNVAGWTTQDSWAHNTNGNSPVSRDCNTSVFTATNLKYLKPSTVGGTDLMLPAGEYIRVYTGGFQDTVDDKWHTFAINKSHCGYNGHYLGNGGDTVYLKDASGNTVDTLTYDFDNGYYIR